MEREEERKDREVKGKEGSEKREKRRIGKYKGETNLLYISDLLLV